MLKRLLALAALTLAAWSGQAADLRVGAQLLPTMYGNPYQPITLPPALIAHMVFDPLVAVGPGGEPRPALATAWTRESALVWVFDLRPNVQFADDTAFNAAAVVAAFEYLRTPEGQRDSLASQDIPATIESVTPRGPLIVAVTTRKPDPVLPLHLSFVRIPSPAHWTALGREGFGRAPIGTGPFVVTEWTGNRVRLKARRESWRAPAVDGLDVIEIPDPTARLQALVSGAVDVALSVSPEDRTVIEAAGGSLIARPMPLVNFLAFVTVKDTPLKDPNVRRALNYAVNRTAIIAAFLDNAVTPAAQFSHASAFGFDPDLAPYPYDPDKARALLREAGYADGFSFSAVLDPTTGGSFVDWYQRMAQDLAQVGVTMTLRMSTGAQMVQSVQSGIWTSDAFAFTFAGFDSLRGYRFRSCAWSHPYHCDKALMPLIAAAESATTAEERLLRTRAVLAAEHDNPPALLLWRGVAFDGLSRAVSDYAIVDDVIRWDRVKLR